MCKAWPDFFPNIIWRLGDGTSIRFWEDSWLDGFPQLSTHVPHNLLGNEISKSVADYVTKEDTWNWDNLHNLLPANILDHLRSHVTPIRDPKKDSLAWLVSANGEFSVKSAYVCLDHNQIECNQAVFSTIWRWKGPERIKLRFWKTAHNSLLTNIARERRGLALENLCPRCHQEPETGLHALRDCVVVKNVWSHLANGGIPPNFINSNLGTWIVSNLTRRNENWRLIFAVTIDELWKARNALIFDQHHVNPCGLVVSIKRRCLEINRAYKECSTFSSKILGDPYGSSLIRWQPPPLGSIKLNCDRAVHGVGRKAGCGGIIKDYLGGFITGFPCKLGQCSILQAELWTIFHGLRIIKDKGFKEDIIVESDSSLAIKFLNEDCNASHSCAPLINSIVELADMEQDLNCSHIYQEANQVVDAMTNLSFDIQDKFQIFNNFLHGIVFSLLTDTAAVSFYRNF
uniref:Ribonuclease H protein At1g65750 family n=1 Tax=Cajanus cajan TaxID=3821 RepID=A0A151TFW7_CAJCA|nr:Putative ribonuclease H protein At1g65750 family [Cajanus cajan]